MCISWELRLYFAHHHFLRFAEIDVFLVLASRLALLDVHDADERHGPAPHEKDGEEDDDDSGGANKLPFFDRFQAQMQAQSVRDGTSQPWQTATQCKEGQNESMFIFRGQKDLI